MIVINSNNSDDYFYGILIRVAIIAILISFYNGISDRSCISKYSIDTTISTQASSKWDKLALASLISDEDRNNKINVNAEFTTFLGDTPQSREKKQVGFIRIPGIVVNYPIMYSKDNNYYLYKDEKGKDDKKGSIYLDSASQGFWNQINLIHGHNMRSGARFGELDKYKNAKWGKKHLYMFITEDDGVEYTYKVFSVFTMNGNKEGIQVACSSIDEYEKQFKLLANRSMYKLTTPPANSKIVILNTCSYSFNGEHLLVCAYREV